MSFVGNSRPASGSEHHLSHYWEMKFQAEGKKPILHGIKVGIGMIAVTKMYETLENEQEFHLSKVVQEPRASDLFLLHVLLDQFPLVS